MSLYTDIFQKNQYQLGNATKQSQTWFQQQARLLSGQNITASRLIGSDASRNVSRIVPGELYLFAYDAKHADTLPYFDMFPMVFPFRKMPDGFMGINLHYLPYKLRIDLLDKLMDFKTNKLMNENTRIKMSWATVQSASRYSNAIPCVHRYLNSQIKSPLKRIDAADWTTALMLPVERFVGASKQKVWTDSLK